MADARSEQIIDAIVALLSVPGLTTTGTNVHRGRAYPYQDEELPALSVYLGSDQVIDELESSFIDWELTIVVEAYVKTVAESVDAVLGRIRKEVHIAIMASYTQGLSFVYDTIPENVSAPVINGEGDQTVITQVFEYKLHYRTSRTDISA